MKPRLTFPRFLLCALALCAAPAIAPAQEGLSGETQRVIVRWRASQQNESLRHATPERMRSLATRTGRPVSRGWNLGGGLSVLQLPRSDLAATLSALRADPDVELAVVDERVRPLAYIPNDPLFATQQWYLQDTQPAAIRAQQAWEISRGLTSPPDSEVIVAVLDTGIRLDHPDLAGKLLTGWDFVSTAKQGNDGDGWDADPSDPGDFITLEDLQDPDIRDAQCGGGVNFDQPVESSWHGTRVAGLIAAASDNGEGITGAGFHVRVLPVRVLGKCGGFVSDVIAGMYWAAGMAPPPPLLQSPLPPVNKTPAKVINLSLGSERPCTEEISEVYRVAVRQITAKGVLVVASAGNSGGEVGAPGGCEGVLGVAGIRQAGTKVGYSSLGPQVDISAPAGNCVLVGPGDPCLFALNTTTNLGSTVPAENGYSSPFVQPTYGTSFSTPLVSGTAALMFAVNPSLTPQQVIKLVRDTARPFPTVSDTNPQPSACQSPKVVPLQSSECLCTTDTCGAGMLDAGAAVAAARDYVQKEPPSTDPAEGGGGHAAPLLPLLLLGLVARRRRPAASLVARPNSLSVL